MDKKDDDSMQVLIPTKNKPALFSYYCGVFGLIPFFGLPFTIAALFLGLAGLRRYKENPTPGAKGHAIVGIILGSIQLAVFAGFILVGYLST